MPFAHAARALALAAAAGGCASGAPAPPIIPTPPRAALERAWKGIADPQLAAEVPIAGPYGAADCVVHLGVYRARATPAQRGAVDRASNAWRAAVVREFGGSERDAAQMIGSSVNPLAGTPAPLRQAAAAWCVAHAPPNP